MLFSVPRAAVKENKCFITYLHKALEIHSSAWGSVQETVVLGVWSNFHFCREALKF